MGMRQQNINMQTEVDRLALLERLKKNREEHRKIVQEAREGYRKRAIAALKERLDAFESGKIPRVGLSFNIQPPESYLRTYDTVIEMQEENKAATVLLGADEFRQLWLNKWDWMRGFLANSASYSMSASANLSALGGEDDE